MSEKSPREQRDKPLPLRREFWKKLLPKIQRGEVLAPETPEEVDDALHTAHAVLIDYLDPILVRDFERPKLPQNAEFYAAFSEHYFTAVDTQEQALWNRLRNEVAQEERVGAQRDGHVAAYHTLTRLGLTAPPSGMELYITLAPLGRVYENLLKEKYADAYVPGHFYDALKQHMPNLLLRFISFDPVIGGVLTINLITKETRRKDVVIDVNAVFDERFFYLDEHDALQIEPALIEKVREHIGEKGIEDDMMQRTKDRGCPVLYAKTRDVIIDFAVDELIAQHKERFSSPIRERA